MIEEHDWVNVTHSDESKMQSFYNKNFFENLIIFKSFISILNEISFQQFFMQKKTRKNNSLNRYAA